MIDKSKKFSLLYICHFRLPCCSDRVAIQNYRVGDKPNWKTLLHHFRREGKLKKEHVLSLVSKALNIFSIHLFYHIESEPNILTIDDPITVVGDIHGQFYDLIKILDVGGDPETKKYIFLGDYIDRGSFSIEVVLTLYSLKVTYCTLRSVDQFPKNYHYAPREPWVPTISNFLQL